MTPFEAKQSFVLWILLFPLLAEWGIMMTENNQHAGFVADELPYKEVKALFKAIRSHSNIIKIEPNVYMYTYIGHIMDGIMLLWEKKDVALFKNSIQLGIKFLEQNNGEYLVPNSHYEKMNAFIT